MSRLLVKLSQYNIRFIFFFFSTLRFRVFRSIVFTCKVYAMPHMVFFCIMCLLRCSFFLLSDKLNACHFNAQRKAKSIYKKKKKNHKRTRMHTAHIVVVVVVFVVTHTWMTDLFCFWWIQSREKHTEQCVYAVWSKCQIEYFDFLLLD